MTLPHTPLQISITPLYNTIVVMPVISDKSHLEITPCFSRFFISMSICYTLADQFAVFASE